MSSSELYSKGVEVWLPDPQDVWVKAEVVSALSNDGTLVVCRHGDGRRETLVVARGDSLPHLANPGVLVAASDLTSLSYLHEPAVMHNLSVRFRDSHSIYTYCGIVLVALNPYHSLPIYGAEVAEAYSGRPLGELEPHVFAVAEEAYCTMMRDGSSQSVIVSGESGAGKTVSAKFALRYFALVGGASSETQLERKVLAAHPLLEALGNAKTTRNDNSSRFGKYLEVGFSREGAVAGATVQTYLLERSRVVSLAEGERNYHIFYQLCSAQWEEPGLDGLGLSDPEAFHYTSMGGCISIPGVNDQSDFTSVREALEMLGFHDDQQRNIFRVLASVLHLGNVEISSAQHGGEEVGTVAEEEEEDQGLFRASVLLGVPLAELRKWLCNRRIATSHEIYIKPLSPAQAVRARDGLAKHLYAALFQCVVGGVNASLVGSGRSHAHIGVLDIYGFEVFAVNSFEQFCINYANEKLQQQFNMHVFKLEQQEYLKEEIDWSFISFHDNQPCIDLIESRLGILDLLDETCKMPQASDEMLLQKLSKVHGGGGGGGSACFSKPRTAPSCFAVRHYAGPVEYEGEGFVEKNVDSLSCEHTALLRASKEKFVAELFKPASKMASKPSNRNSVKRGSGLIAKATVGSQFRSSLSQLMCTLNSTTPHYIRCIKPNDHKLPFVYDPQRVAQQLRACGILETIRISAAGYPSRWPYQDFLQRYRALLLPGQRRTSEEKAMTQYILNNCIPDPDKYRLGRTKVFFRAGQVAYLERLRSLRLHACGVAIQRRVRGWLQRARFTRLRTATLALQAHARGMLARRLAWQLRQTRAAVCLQRHVRGTLRRRGYQRLRRVAIAIQTYYRGAAARKLCCSLRQDRVAVVIQSAVRGWLQRRAYRAAVRGVVLLQSCVRRWRAHRELLRLKAEARSVDHLRHLNRGMENKIIELQQKLTNQLELNGQLSDKVERLVARIPVEVGVARAAEEKACALEAELTSEKGRGILLEQELKSVKLERDQTQCKLAELENRFQELQNELEAKRLESEPSTPPRGKGADSNSIATPQSSKSDIYRLQRLRSVTSPLQQAFKTGPDSIPATPTRRPQGSPRSIPNTPTRLHSKPELEHGNGTTTSRKALNPSHFKKMEEQLSAVVSELAQHATPLNYGFSPDSIQRPMSFKLKTPFDPDSLLRNASAQNGYETDSLEGSPLLSQSFTGLKHAFQLINSLATFNLSLQGEVARLANENLLMRDSTAEKPLPNKEEAPPTSAPGNVPLTPLSPRKRAPTSRHAPNGSPLRRSVSNTVAKATLGMLSWKPRDLSQILKRLILELEPKSIAGPIPCMPAHVLFMCLRYADHYNSEEQASGLMEGMVSALHHVTQGCHGNLDLLAFWLANIGRLMHNLQQYSGEEPGGGREGRLVNFDLTEYGHALRHRAMGVYHQIIHSAHSRLKPLIVPGLLEHDAIPGISTSRPIGSKKKALGSRDVVVTIETVVTEMTSILETLKENFIEPQIILQIIRQLFYIINAHMLNNLLLRRDMCHWTKGVQIRYNVSQLEDWCRTHGLASKTTPTEQLLPVVQATKLLQIRKAVPSDVDAICDLCTRLNALQVQKILTMYTPVDEFEDRVPESVIRLVSERGGADEVDPAHIMIDVNRFFPIEFQYSPSNVSFSSLSLPPSAELGFLVKL